MPKKKDKKKGDKQDDERKTSPKDSSAKGVNKPSSDDKEKNVYLTQIRYLNERLERYQLKCDQLESQNKDLISQCRRLETEKKDIVEYLKHSLLEKEDEVDELTELLESQQRAADKARDDLQLQHSQLRQELQEQIEELTSKNAAMAMTLSGLEEFQKQKEELMSHLESLEKQLDNQMEEHKAEIHSLEMKALLEKKNLEKEMESHVTAMTAKLQDLVDQRVPERTRLALQENAEVKAQLSQLSEQAQHLMVENSSLRDRKGQLCVDVDILEQLLSETSRQSCIRKKVVEQLKEKCQQTQVELNDSKQELERLQTEHSGVLTEMEALRLGRDSLSEQCSKNRAKVSRLEGDLQEERRRKSRLKVIIQEAAFTLRQALMAAPTEQDGEVNSVLQWKRLMEKLLLLLDPPELTNPPCEKQQLTEVQTSDPVKPRVGSVNPALSLHFELARQRTGDQGLVAQPTPKHKHMSPRMGVVSSSTDVPLHRKPFSLKTASSIYSTDSSVRFLMSKNSFTKPK